MQSFVQQKDSNAKMKPLIALQPPKLSNLELQFSEEVVWQRLQIREFVFRFENLLALTAEDRNLLQDAQGDWVTHRMLKKLVCSLMELIAHYGVENDTDQQKMAKQFLQDEHIASSRPYLSLQHWQTISATLLAAGYEDTPVFNDEEAIATSDAQQQMDWLPSFVTRSMQANGTGPMPIVKDALKELKTINLLSMCTLYTPCIRKDLLQGSVQLKDEEDALHALRRQTMSDEMHARTTKNTLLQQLATAEEQDAIQQKIEDVDNKIDEQRHLLNRKEVDVYLLSRRTSKRLSSAGTDQHGNQYWLFGDLHHYQDDQDQDFWGRGVIIIGPGCHVDDEQPSEEISKDGHRSPCVARLTTNNSKRWWYLSGIENIDMLVQWLNHHSEPKHLIRQLSSRSRYLNHLLS
ncbi:hypothetical protein K450DRAFT_243981 [Umbelopsis ramanniana AG]|uniref:Uncharacterized protein n=1 Tax=Umbelopsis ramanniana AG TaxID=1314678 RepID=A0AAD5HDL7_UMBRA|nr:uncharacterized protein K450DRAFT_243981 [Umbelopsis ramanniana AG]KAI8579119.1 hypothetical protein K450DRAFT_243981 [Umbelopsis ramanniana AG]